MKTIILLSALATIASAVPTRLGSEDVETDSTHNGLFKSINRDRKSIVQDSPTELSLDHESGSIANQPQAGKTHQGFKKPIIVKKKFGYHIFRDSDEELAQAEPRENCRRQFRFKLCDESAEPIVNNIRSFNTEDIEESDVQHSLKMAKEAVEILQRDLQKIEESTKIIQKNRGDDLEGKLQKTINQARHTSEQFNENIENVASLALKSATSKESTSEIKITNTEQAKMAEWKEAIKKIQKNVDVKNMEDTFKSTENKQEIESNNLSTNDNIHSLDNNIAKEKETSREKANDDHIKDKQHTQVKHVETDMETFATENKPINVGLHSDSLKLEKANWDINESNRNAENGDAEKKVNALQESHLNVMKPQQKNTESEKGLETLNTSEESHLKEEMKSSQLLNTGNTDTKQISKKSNMIEDIEKSINEVNEKSSNVENNNENLMWKSNDLELVEDNVKHIMRENEHTKKAVESKNMDNKDMDLSVSIDHKSLQKNANEEENAKIIENKNTIHSDTTLNQDLVQEGTVLAKNYFPMEKSTSDNSETNKFSASLETQIPIMRSVGDINLSTSLNGEESLDATHLKFREAVEENSTEKQILENTMNMKDKEELHKVEEKLRSTLHVPTDNLIIGDENPKSDLVTSADNSHTKMHSHVDSQLSSEKHINNENTWSLKSVDSKSTNEKSKYFINEAANEKKLLNEEKSMHFGEQNGNLRNKPNNNLAVTKDFQQRMSEMDYFNSLNSQHNAQLVQDKNLDFHTSSHINQGMSEWDRNQQQLHSMLRPSFMPWMHDRFRSNMDAQVGNTINHDHHLSNMYLEDHLSGDMHQHDHNLGHLHFDGLNQHAIPLGRFVNNFETGMNQEMLNSPVMRENVLENSAMDLDSSMQPSIMKMHMRDALDQNSWAYHHANGKSGFSSSGGIAGAVSPGSGAVGVFPNASGGCGIPLLLSCSPSVVSGSLAKQALGYSGHAFRSGDDLRFYSKRDAQGLNEIPKTKVKTYATSSG